MKSIDITFKSDIIIVTKEQEGNEMLLVVEHDNGKAGQRGYSEHEIQSKSEAAEIIKSYEEKNIFIYAIHF